MEWQNDFPQLISRKKNTTTFYHQTHTFADASDEIYSTEEANFIEIIMYV